MVKRLRAEGYRAVVVDDLSTGFRAALPDGCLWEGDLADEGFLSQVFETERPVAVMHFAGSISVGESVACPDSYYRNNLSAGLVLIEVMRRFGVSALIFSSTAAVYGEPEHVPIGELHRCAPINPYGRSKWMFEQILADQEAAYGLRSICFRYFNAAGADPDGELGECHEPETHLIPLVLQVASGRRESISVYGTDYDTPDGTCIRDYVHVYDLCSAHLLGLQYLLLGGCSGRFNLGNGDGFSVREVIDVAREVTGCAIPTVEAARREGDPPRLVADSSLARSVLGWQPGYHRLSTIVGHAWAWERGGGFNEQ